MSNKLNDFNEKFIKWWDENAPADFGYVLITSEPYDEGIQLACMSNLDDEGVDLYMAGIQTKRSMMWPKTKYEA